jgi:hypothetical protein
MGAGRAVAAPSFIEALFAPSARLWPRWEAHDPGSARVIDHAPWERFLAGALHRRADGVMGLAYGSVGAADRALLRGYLAALAATPVSGLARAEQFAFWANLYNALTVRVVLDRYPVASIRDISLGGGLFSSGPWGAKLVEIEGEALSLNDIEHRILRPIWRDPRVHYAVNCASVGCPDLRPRAFTGAGLEAALNEAARDYVNHPRGVSAAAGGMTLSSIYNWFADDFGGEAGVLAHLRRHASPALRAAIDRAPVIAGYHYDWSLNDVAAPRVDPAAPRG